MTNFMRQLDIFNPEDFENYRITIVGCGGIGSALGICLAKLGMKKFILWDADLVQRHNVPNQLFEYGAAGYPKVEKLRDSIKNYHPDYSAEVVPFGRKLDSSCYIMTPIVFACTDSMSSRKLIYEVALKSRCRLLIDGRMSGKAFRIFTVNLTRKSDRDAYERTLHEDMEQSCTNRAIIYNIFAVSSFMANQLTRVFQNKKYPFEMNVCLENYLIRNRYLEKR